MQLQSITSLSYSNKFFYINESNQKQVNADQSIKQTESQTQSQTILVYVPRNMSVLNLVMLAAASQHVLYHKSKSTIQLYSSFLCVRMVLVQLLQK